MRRIAFGLPVLLLISLALPSPAFAAGTNPNLFQAFDYDLTPEQIQQIAPQVSFVWGASSYYVQNWTQANPSITLSTYLSFNRDPDASHDLNWWKANHPDWVLYKCDRKTPSYKGNEPYVPLDFSNPAVQQWQVDNYVKPALQAGYNAIGWDNLDPNWWGACGHFDSQGNWVQQYNGDVFDPAWHAAVLNWLQNQHSQLQQLHMLSIPNVDYAGWDSEGLAALQPISDASDGIFVEQGFLSPQQHPLTGQSWQDLTSWLSYTIGEGKMLFSSNGFQNPPQAADIEWAISNYLLDQDNGLEALWISQNQFYGRDDIFPEYSLVPSLGSPQQSASATGGLWTRPYDNGLVLVNSDTVQHSFTLPGPLKDLEGNSYSGAITLQSGSGLTLVNA